MGVELLMLLKEFLLGTELEVAQPICDQRRKKITGLMCTQSQQLALSPLSFHAGGPVTKVTVNHSMIYLFHTAYSI